MKMEEAKCSETSANKIQMLGNHPQERIQYGNDTLCFRIVREFIDYEHVLASLGLRSVVDM
jgi:hypothetical protein